jgi:hypothetical protein
MLNDAQKLRGPTIDSSAQQRAATPSSNALPAVSLPKGGGAMHGIGEKFAAHPGPARDP